METTRICKKCGATTEIAGHHLDPKSFFGVDSDGRVLLCKECRAQISQSILPWTIDYWTIKKNMTNSNQLSVFITKNQHRLTHPNMIYLLITEFFLSDNGFYPTENLTYRQLELTKLGYYIKQRTLLWLEERK